MPDNLQFDRADLGSAAPAMAGTVTCSSCGSSIADTYYVANGQIVCERCRRTVEAEWNRGGAAGRFGKALGLGILAMIGCSILWYAVLAATDSQWGILAIVVGFVVGGAVRKGSNGRGGWRYQALAIFLTYTAIVSSYVPYMIQGVRERRAEIAATVPADSGAADNAATHSDAAFSKDSTEAAAQATKIGPLGVVIGSVILLGFLYALPFLAGMEDLIGILIIGFALYEAWKLNRKMELRISGPHQVSTTGARA